MSDRLAQVSQHLSTTHGRGLLAGEVAIITGAGQGIGRSAALLFAREGAKVVISDIDEKRLATVAEEIKATGGDVLGVAGDVGADDFPKKIVDATVQKYGKINHIINNAGFTFDKMLHTTPDDTFDIILKIHVRAPFRLVRQAAPYFRLKPEARENRSIVNVSSTSGLHGNVGQANYAAAKAAVIGLTKTIAKEWGPYGVRANTVAFGLIHTRLTAAKEAGVTMEIDGKKVALGVPGANPDAPANAPNIPLRRGGNADEAAAAMLLCVFCFFTRCFADCSYFFVSTSSLASPLASLLTVYHDDVSLHEPLPLLRVSILESSKMDPVSAATAVITFGTFAKDLVELFLKVKESIEKVGENNKRLQELTEDILRTLDGLVNLTLGKNDTSEAPALFIALGGLQRQMLHVLEGCRAIPPTEPSQGRQQHLKSQMKMWWNRDKIEAEIRRLKELTNECYTQFTLFSTARTEEKTVQIANSTGRIETSTVQIANSTAQIETSTVQIANSTGRIEIGSVQIADTTTRIADNTAQVQVSVLEQKLEKWLQSPPNMAETQHATQKLHHEGTGGWFLNGNQFGEWRDCPGCLWIEGNSGAGKSVLSSIVIRKLFDDRKSSLGSISSIGYFYFDFRDEKKQIVEIMLRSIILQLSAQSPKPYTVLEQAYNSSKGQTLPTYQNLLDILDQLFQEFNHTYIILDALDECNEHELVVQLISRLRGQNKGPLHLLFTSQSREIFTAAFDGVPHLLLGPQTTWDDIGHFVASELQSKRLKHWARHTTEITTKVLEKSDGMFRFAACLLVELSRNIFISDPEQVLANLPSDLFEIYNRFLSPIQPSAFPYVERVLRWLICSAQPLALPELEDCLAFELPESHQHGVYDPAKRGDYANRVCELLEGLVTVTAVAMPPYWVENEEDSARWKHVTLAHTSVAEYLVSRGFAENHCEYDLNQERSHTFLAQTCVGYLLHFTDHPFNSETFLNYPLSSYAAKYWIYHLKRCHDRALLSNSTILLLEGNSTQYKALNHIHNIDDPWDMDPDWTRSIPSPLYLCSRIEYIEGVQFLLEEGADVNASEEEHGSALQAASSQGHMEIVQFLVEKGADVNAAGEFSTSALQAASKGGNMEVVQFLIEKGADVNAAGGSYGSALQAASKGGNMELVQFLVEKGADINAASGSSSSALQAASERGNMELVQFLVEKGADVNAVGGDYGSALQAASRGGNMEVVRFLVEKGADVNAVGGFSGSALQAASRGGNMEVVQFLVEKGADINAADGSSGSALQAASKGGNMEVVQFLVEKGADINAAGGYYGSALQAASRGNMEVVQFLVENGADINAAGGFSGSALQGASQGGNMEVVQFLVENGADINALGGSSGSALQAASQRGNMEVVQFLVEKGADINAADGSSGSALQAASRGGNMELVQFLIEKGADINAASGSSSSALQAASRGGKMEVVQFLVEKGADVNAVGGDRSSALQAASREGNEEVVRFLVEKGADVNTADGSALRAASGGGNMELVQFLVEKGADVNAVGGEYGSALQAAFRGGHMEVVQFLVEKGANVNAAGGSSGSALQAASKGGNMEVVQLLVEKGADINAAGGYYGSALQAASGGGNMEVVRFLVEKGADIDAAGEFSTSALQAASKGGNMEVVQFLIEKGADINAAGKFSGSALQAASEGGNMEVVQFLVEKGADINAVDGYYGSALQAASKRGNMEVVQYLLEKGADINAVGGEYGTALQAAASWQGSFGALQWLSSPERNTVDTELALTEVARFLVENGANVNTVGGRFGSPLHAACMEGNIETVRFLIEKGADMYAPGACFGSALQAAVSKIQFHWSFDDNDIVDVRKVEVIRLLLEIGADINTWDPQYGTALQAACACFKNERIVRFLLENGADVDAPGGKDGNAMQIASKNYNAQIVPILIEYGAQEEEADGNEDGYGEEDDEEEDDGGYGDDYGDDENDDQELNSY
ncbi:ankyrin repeat-containing domain protein [Mycena epipterygia]|nr:ankyrin repeat-containing domain protein [Mycena epipterygia]